MSRSSSPGRSIAVAVITALSTLAATALTGLYARRSAGRQLAHQRQLALDQQEFVKADRLRDIRRQASGYLMTLACREAPAVPRAVTPPLMIFY